MEGYVTNNYFGGVIIDYMFAVEYSDGYDDEVFRTGSGKPDRNHTGNAGNYIS